MAFGITTNPYNAMLSMSKGNLKQLIWNGLIFDPGTHNPGGELPVGKFMRMNINLPDAGIIARSTIFIQGWGWDLLFNPIFIEIESATNTNSEVFSWLINFWGGQNIPYPEGSTVHILFNDDTYKSGTLDIRDNESSWYAFFPVTFGEDPELDEIIDNSPDKTVYNKCYDNEYWPILNDEFNTNFDMGNLAFYEYIDDVVIGNLRSNVSVKGIVDLESITLEDDSIVYPDYHGEDGNSRFVKCVVARDWATNGVLGDMGVDLDWCRGYRNSDYISFLSDFNGVDPRPYTSLVLELYPNVAYIQKSPVWMAVRKVFIGISGNEANGIKYRLVTTENNKNNMPFIYGGPWTKNGPIGQDYRLEISREGYHDFSADNRTVWSTPASNGLGLQGTWKWDIGQVIGVLRNDHDSPIAVVYEAANPSLNDYPWEGDTDYTDLMRYEHYVIVDTFTEYQADWMTANYNELMGLGGNITGFIVAGVSTDVWEMLEGGMSFDTLISNLAEQLGHPVSLDDLFNVIIPQEWLCFNTTKNDSGIYYNYEGWLDSTVNPNPDPDPDPDPGPDPDAE